VQLPLAILGLAGLTFLLRSEREIFIPIVLSVLLSYALAPAVDWIDQHGAPRFLATLVVLLAFLSALVGVAALVVDDALRLAEQVPDAIRQLREQFEASRGQSGGGLVARAQRAIGALREAAAAARETSGTPAPAAPAGGVLAGTATVLGGLTDAVVVIFLVFFQLWSGDLYRRKLLAIAGPRLSRRRATLRTLVDIESRIRRFLVVRVVTGLIVALATWLGLQWIGLEHAFVWGLLAGVLNAIPYVGPIIVSGGLLVVGLVQFGSATIALSAAALALVVTSLEGWLLDPLLMGRAERINAVAVLVGLVFWTAVWGAWGAFLAVPMLAILKSICDHNRQLAAVGKLLAER
jgi:predicted PurR-regulated permease PerM